VSHTLNLSELHRLWRSVWMHAK